MTARRYSGCPFGRSCMAMLDARRKAPAPVKADRGPGPDQATVCGTGRNEPEERPIEGVDPGRHEADPAQAEREDGILCVARVVRRRSVGGEHGQVGLPAEPVVKRGQQVRDRLVGAPGILEPALPDLRVGSAVDPALTPERGAQTLVVAQVAVVAEGKSTGWIVKRLGVGLGQRRQPRWPPQVNERGGRLGCPNPLASRIVAKRSNVAVRVQVAIGPDPGGAPAEPGDPVGDPRRDGRRALGGVRGGP